MKKMVRSKSLHEHERCRKLENALYKICESFNKCVGIITIHSSIATQSHG